MDRPYYTKRGKAIYRNGFDTLPTPGKERQHHLTELIGKSKRYGLGKRKGRSNSFLRPDSRFQQQKRPAHESGVLRNTKNKIQRDGRGAISKVGEAYENRGALLSSTKSGSKDSDGV